MNAKYNFDTNFSEYTTEFLKSELEKYVNGHREWVIVHKELINSMLNEAMPKWQVRTLDVNRLTIDRKDKESCRRGLDFDIYFGYPMFGDEEFEFKINPSTIGSFSLLQYSEEVEYFTTVGVFVTNHEFAVSLKEVLYDYHIKVRELRDAIYVLQSELRKRETLEKQAAETAESNSFAEEIKAAIKNVDNPETTFVVVDKTPCGHIVNASYRRRPVKVLNLPGSHNKCWKYLQDNMLISKPNIVIMPVSKIKMN